MPSPQFVADSGERFRPVGENDAGGPVQPPVPDGGLESNPSTPLEPPPAGPNPPKKTQPRTGLLRSLFSMQGRGTGSVGGRGGALGELGDLAKMLLEQGGDLAALPADLQEQLAQIQESELADAKASFSSQRKDLLRSLFGQGLNRSTIAGDVGSRLVEGEARALSAVRSAAAQRALQLRADIANRRLQAAGVAANALGAKLQGEVGFANVAAQNARTGAMLSIAAMENQTRLAQLDFQKESFSQSLELDRDKFDFSREAFFSNQDLQRELAQLQANTQLSIADKGKPSVWERIFGGIGAAIPFL